MKKIAIQGHPIRGKEVIQILESLGGKKLYYSNANDKCLAFFIDDKGYISCLHYENTVLKEYYKIYTLKEFEKEFPFKPGDIVIDNNGNEGFITGLIITMNNKILYSVKYNYNQSGIVSPNLLKLKNKEMNTRNITLTLDKAKEWYKQGGDLKEVALQAFTEQELNPPPKSWEEYCKGYKVPSMIFGPCTPNKYVALWKLERLRDCYRQGWTPDPKESVYAIKRAVRGLNVYYFCSQEFLSFQSEEVAKEFLKNFEPLIKEAGDLI